MQKPIIFGSDGFIGSHLSEQFPNSFKVDLKRNLNILNFEMDWLGHERNFDCICILSANPDMSFCEENILSTIKNNYCTTIIAVEVANILKIPLLFTSTSMVYKNNEASIEKPMIPYGERYTKSKILSENYIVSHCRTPYSIVRLANCIGGGERHGVIWDLMTKEEDKVKVRGTGKQLRSYVHVSDFVRFIEELSSKLIHKKKGYEDCKIINFGNEDLVSVKEIVKSIRYWTGKDYYYDHEIRVFDPNMVKMEYPTLERVFPKFKKMDSHEAVRLACKETWEAISHE